MKNIDDDRPGVDLDAPGVIKSTCEFCKKSYYIDAVNFRVMHDLPMCNTFEVVDPVEFLKQNRKIKEEYAKLNGKN